MNILITGSRKGIGHFMATQYLERGHTVIGCSRSEAEIDHPQYCHFEVDVTDEKAIRAMLREITRTFGSLDALITNAGVASMNHLLTTTRDTAQNIIDTNLMGTFLMTRDCGKLMSRAGKGRIINLTTVAAGLRLEGEAIYAASKAAVANFTQTAARELAPFNITVNAIGPTPIETDLIKAVPKDKIQNLINLQPIKRLGVYEDVLNVCDFFLDDRSDFITGQVIYLGGVHD